MREHTSKGSAQALMFSGSAYVCSSLTGEPTAAGVWVPVGFDVSSLVPATRTVNGHALSANVTVTKSDLGLPNVLDGAFGSPLIREDANTVSLRNGINPQRFNVLGSYTDASNFQRLTLVYNDVAGEYRIQPEHTGSGQMKNLVLGSPTEPNFANIKLWTDGSIYFQKANTVRWVMDDTGLFFPNTDNTLDFGDNTHRARDIKAGTSVTAPIYKTTTNCADSAGAAACGSASSGAVVIDASATSVVVSTTAVTATSRISISEDASLGTELGITCNSSIVRVYQVTARTAGTSFTISSSAAPVANPACLSYVIIN